MEYIDSDEFDHSYQLNSFRPEMVGAYFESNPKEVVLYRYYCFKVDQEVLWCLSYPILEQLQSFTIQRMSTIKDYIKVVGRFRSLQQIRFLMSNWFEPCLSSENEKNYCIDDNESDTKGTHNDEVIRDMLRFVQEHTRLFPGCLKTVICLEKTFWNNDDLRTGDRIQQDLYRLLPPLHEPTYIAQGNWKQLLAHPHSVDLSHVQELDDKDFPEFWYEEGATHPRQKTLPPAVSDYEAFEARGAS